MMKRFKVYFRFKGKMDSGYFEATSEQAARWRVLGRFYGAAIQKMIEVAI